MDLHISVIADIKNILEKHVEIVDWCMSGHSWVLKKEKVCPKYLNPNTWTQIDKQMIENFQKEYDSFLCTFDGFIVAYPGSFIMLFEKYNKPIIMVNAVRYDLPFCWSRNSEMMSEYNSCLHRLQQKNLLFPISNNLADQSYMFEGSGIKTQHIPSLCMYTGMRYSNTMNNGRFLCYTGSTGISHPLIIPKNNLKSPFEWSDIAFFKGIIHFPYEISTMSMFEHFSARMPLFFPSKQYTYANVDIQSSSAYWKQNDCPYEQFRKKETWLDLSDMYNVFNKSPNVYFFDSIPHLFHLIENFEWKDDSEFFETYVNDILHKWHDVINDVRFYKIKQPENKHLCYNRLPLLANVIYDVNYDGSGVKAQHTYERKESFTKGDVVFVKTDLLYAFITQVLPKINVDFILVTGVSDLSPTPDQAECLINNPKIVQWIGCNILQTDKKILKIPIGVGEPERINGNHELLKTLHSQRIHFDKKPYSTICAPFHSNTHTSRTSLQEITLPKQDYQTYMKTINDYKFVLCMRGNGIDTHRFCEILLMGSVPVIEHSGLDDMYTQFPCAFTGETDTFTWNESAFLKFLDLFWLNKLY